MKKFISLIMVGVLLIAGCLPVFAQSTDDYDIVISIPKLIRYDPEKKNSFIGNHVSFNVYIYGIERFEKFKVFIDFDTDLLELESTAVEEWIVVSSGGSATETGAEFSAYGTEWIKDGHSYVSSISGWMRVKGAGKLNINVRAEATDKDGKPMDVKVKINEYCDEVVDVSSYHIRIDEKYLYNEKPKHAFFDIGTTVSEVIELVVAENVAVKNAAGEIMAPDALIATGSRIVTLFNGYEVEAKNVCIKYDVDCNGEITASDARLALRYSAVLENLDDLQYFAAEVTGDKQVTASDARKILRFASGLE